MPCAERWRAASVLRRIAPPEDWTCSAEPGLEGQACAFRLVEGAAPITVEAASGRAMSVAPGGVFLGTPGHRESTRWTVGGVPEHGLVPGADYWVIAESGIVGELGGESAGAKTHLGRVTHLGVLRDPSGRALSLAGAALPAAAPDAADAGAPVFLVLGTSAEVGKTTAGLAVLRALRQRGHGGVAVLKATGTSALVELSLYLDLGASWAFDCVDLGLPTTYPSGRAGIAEVFDAALDAVLRRPADAVLVECGGDVLGANVPVFLERLTARRPSPTVVLAAGDALGAYGAVLVLERSGLRPTLVTGPCTDLPTLRARTEALCGVRAANLRRGTLEVALGHGGSGAEAGGDGPEVAQP